MSTSSYRMIFKQALAKTSWLKQELIGIVLGCVVEFRVHGLAAWRARARGDVFANAAILYRASARADHQSPARTRKLNFSLHYRLASCQSHFSRRRLRTLTLKIVLFVAVESWSTLCNNPASTRLGRRDRQIPVTWSCPIIPYVCFFTLLFIVFYYLFTAVMYFVKCVALTSSWLRAITRYNQFTEPVLTRNSNCAFLTVLDFILVKVF